jgi:ABC-type multidrug transport system fused ATPase/permease subunit
LDAENETLILEGLRVAAKGRLTIVVAHTLSALAIVDRIVVLHRGRVVETGSVAQLSRANGYFASQHRTHLEDGISPGSVL